MNDILFRILFTVAASAVLTGASYKMFQILQLSSYRLRGVYAWFRTTKFDYASRYFALAFLAFVGMLVYLSCFSVFRAAYYFGALVFLGFGAAFIAISTRADRKTPLKTTPRVWRTAIAALVLNAALAFALLWLGDFLPAADYALTAVAFFLIPITTAAAHSIMLPVEKLIQSGYLRKAKRALSLNPGLIKIGITGSFGKTTAKNMLAEILGKKYKTLATPASYNTPMGICKSVNASLTGDTQVFIAEMGARNIGDIAELCDLVRPSVGLITGVGNQHLETFGSIANIAAGKYELIEGLGEKGSAYFNGDNGIAADMFHRCKIAKHLTGRSGTDGAEVVYADAATGRNGTSFTLRAKGESAQITTALLGGHIPGLAALCAAAALDLGVTLPEIAAAMAELKPVPHRLQLIDRGDTLVIDDAYNANLDGAKNALDVLAGFPGARIVVTPGLVELGAAEEASNHALGVYIAACADYAVLNSSRAAWIKKGCIAGGMAEDKIFTVAGLAEASALLEKFSDVQRAVLFENDLPDNMM